MTDYARNRSAKALDILLKNGLNPIFADRWHPPLIKAAERNSLEEIEILLDHGADVNIITHEYRPPMSCAVQSLEAVQILFRHGANLNLRASNGWSMLLWAYLIGYEEAAKFLISHNTKLVEDKSFRELGIRYVVSNARFMCTSFV